nr:MAG TPA: hypothetical protein [Caudoviricetes sp.]
MVLSFFSLLSPVLNAFLNIYVRFIVDLPFLTGHNV